MTLVAIKVGEGRYWHAGSPRPDGGGWTLCGRWGVLDHAPDGDPIPAVLVLSGVGHASYEQPVECLKCWDKMRRLAAGRGI